ncbi:MAG: CDP-diacylglycerol--glycerol-3-phosphate 3-phosphatidyltransferase [Helicobacteraceae bacterium]|jgi:CDP-diacylglycerol--glycerol-3-phosphate 3-phosphatidyltransferase|nr:CDP-diacylglycerol--glycerol-3-phosphate 3-phosphatidyltransferase [Helicobacteraceae bacterium]
MNLPNSLALARIAAAPLIFLLLVNRDIFGATHATWLDYFAGLLFVFAAITDFFDGMIARLFNQATKLGSILDPLADKLLMLSAFLGLTILGRANAWAVFIILGREFFITGLRVVIAAEGKTVSASLLGKWKTGAQIGACIALIVNWFAYVGDILLWIAVAMTLWSGIEYVIGYAKQQ